MAKSVKQILSAGNVPTVNGNIDYAALRKEITILNSAANKRLKRLEQSGVVSEAMELNARHGGKFSVKGMSDAELIGEFARVQSFLKSSTSTVKGAKIAQNRRNLKHDKEGIAKLERDSLFWDVYSRLRDTGELGRKITPSAVETTINNVREAHPNWGVDRVYKEVVRTMKNATEEAEAEAENARREAGVLNASDLFELGDNF